MGKKQLNMLRNVFTDSKRSSAGKGTINGKQSLSHRKPTKIKKQLHGKLIDRIDYLQQRTKRAHKNIHLKIDSIIQTIDEQSQVLGQTSVVLDKNGQSFDIQNEIQNGSEQSAVQKSLNKIHQSLLYEKPLKTIQGQFGGVYSKLSNFSKNTKKPPIAHKDYRQELNPSLDKQEKSAQFSSDVFFRQLSSQDYLKIQELIKVYYLRAGNFEAVKALNEKNRKENMFKQAKSTSASKQAHIRAKIETQEDPFCDSQNLSDELDEIQRKNERPVQISESDSRRIQQFEKLFGILADLRDGKFEKAIQWCRSECLYETKMNKLEYQLRLLKINQEIKKIEADIKNSGENNQMSDDQKVFSSKDYISLILAIGNDEAGNQENGSSEIFEEPQKSKRQKYFSHISQYIGLKRFVPQFQSQVSRIIGYLLYLSEWGAIKQSLSESETKLHESILERLEEYYQNLPFEIVADYQKNFCEKLCREFQILFLTTNSQSINSSLKVCHEVGKLHFQEVHNQLKMITSRKASMFGEKSQGKNRPNDEFPQILPFEVEMDSKYQYHSLFVCPITKEILSANDNAGLLPCGHLLSQAAKRQMREIRRNSNKDKCPVCRTAVKNDEIIRVEF